MDKPEYICYNKYIQITEPDWTEEEENILAQFYEECENKTNIDLSGIMDKLGQHTKRGTLYKLERLTREKNINPVYRMGRENIQNIEWHSVYSSAWEALQDLHDTFDDTIVVRLLILFITFFSYLVPLFSCFIAYKHSHIFNNW